MKKPPSSFPELDSSDLELFTRFHLVEKIQVLKAISGNNIESKRFFCDIVPKYSDGPHGPHLIIITDKYQGKQEFEHHKEAASILPKNSLPVLIEYQEIEEKSILLYQISTAQLLKSDTLSSFLAKKNFDIDNAQLYTEIVSRLLLRWTSSHEVESFRTTISVFDLIAETKQRIPSNPIWNNSVSFAAELISPETLSILFEGINRPLPNPLAYIQNEHLWRDAIGNLPTVIRFGGKVHGNLNSNNILVCPVLQNKEATELDLIHLLDFSNFNSSAPLFEDTIHFELDISRHIMSIKDKADISEWLHLSEYLTSSITPVGRPKGVKAPVVWSILQPLRAITTHYQESTSNSLKEFYKLAFWIGYFVGAIDKMFMSHLNQAEKLSMLMIGALSLDNVLKALDIYPSYKTPYYLEWNSGKLDITTETKKNSHINEVEKLTNSIKELICSEDNIEISSKVVFDEINGIPNNIITFTKGDATKLIITQNQAAKFSRLEPSSTDQYLISLIIHKDFGPWDTRYVPLKGITNRPILPKEWSGHIPVQFYTLHRRGEGPEQRIERVPIDDITEAINRYQQFIILGEPGAGKTTILQKLTLEFAKNRLKNPNAPIPLLVRLSSYRADVSPFSFLESIWNNRLGSVKEFSSFEEAIRSGGVVFLLDALNEMNRSEYIDQVINWRNFIQDHDRVRMIFTCRTLDYSLPLQIQQIETQKLDDKRIKEFLTQHLQKDAERVWDLLFNSPLLDLARNPFILTILSWVQAQYQADLPLSKGLLLDAFAKELMYREELLGHPDWIEMEALSRTLSTLAWEFQRNGEGTSMPVKLVLQDILPETVEVRGRIIHTPPPTVLMLGQSANILEETEDGQVRFYHHLLQELFAARELVRQLESSGSIVEAIWKAPLFLDEMPESKTQGEWDPLAPPPTTGWEETSIVAASLLEDATDFINSVCSVNPILAGRCVVEGQWNVSDEVKSQIRKQLVETILDSSVHLRARIAAGKALSNLGDSRFSIKTMNARNYIEPPMVHIPSGKYLIGAPSSSSEAFENEFPQHEISLGEFMISKYLITVAEFKHFVDDGGYQDIQWWQGKMSQAWWRGEEIEGGAIDGMLKNRLKLIESGEPLEYWQTQFGWRPKTFEFWKNITSMSESGARNKLRETYQGRTRRTPLYWEDLNYHSPNSPIVGVTWIEAQAYANWLSVVAGQNYRLPSEVEWEVAAKGNIDQNYPWGNDFDDPYCTNTVEGKVLGTTPVGIYPTDVSVFGVYDVVGNVREWTNSLDKPYPYSHNDNREDTSLPGERVMRSGAWSRSHNVARCTYRDHFGIDFCDYNIGFRLCSSIK